MPLRQTDREVVDSWNGSTGTETHWDCGHDGAVSCSVVEGVEQTTCTSSCGGGSQHRHCEVMGREQAYRDVLLRFLFCVSSVSQD